MLKALELGVMVAGRIEPGRWVWRTAACYAKVTNDLDDSVTVDTDELLVWYTGGIRLNHGLDIFEVARNGHQE